MSAPRFRLRLGLLGRPWACRTRRGGPSLAVAAGAAIVMGVCAAGPLLAAPPVGRVAAVAGSTPVATPSAPDAVRGQELFAEHCAECHGVFGRGDGVRSAELPVAPASFAAPEVVRAATPREAFEVITNGRLDQLMPPWRDDLDERERWDALYGAWSFYYTSDRLARGRADWLQLCAACHGDGQVRNEPPHATSLAAAVGVSVPWPTDRLLDASQDDLLRRTLALTDAHASLVGADQARLRSSLDFARAGTFVALPFDQLAVDGVIRGRLALGSAGEVDLSAAEVLAIAFVDGVPGETVTGTVSASGAFTLTGLVAGANTTQRIVVRFDGADYVRNEDVALTREEPERSDVVQTVYLADPHAALDIRTGHLLVTPRPELGVVRIAEVWIVRNGGDRVAVAGDDGATLRLTLPREARAIAFADPRIRAGAALEGDVLALAAAMFPGDNEVAITYELPYEGDELRLARAMDVPVASLQIIAMAPGADITSAVLGPTSAMTIESGVVAVAEGVGLPSGASVQARITGLPRSQAAAESGLTDLAPRLLGQDVLRVLGALGVLAAVAVGVGYPVLAARRAPSDRAARARRAYNRQLDRLATLEARHAAGSVGDAAYARERAALISGAMQAAGLVDESEGSS